ncbi:hypothetical protein [Hugenholtzia roseola]|uniref:hypothetical protein n=1 Tax=Hugenholtzia roseola TaxID=1002 RepID=UPI00040F370C|nr:hypothetical protein [Hugenholtzia roseola]
MPIQKTSTYLIYQEDFQQRTLTDRLKLSMRLMQLEPIHRYLGELRLYDDILEFEGKDTETGEPHLLLCSGAQIKRVFLGFDGFFTNLEDFSAGFTFKPLRLTIVNGNHTLTPYFITNFNKIMRTSDNEKWATKIEQWAK